MKVTIPILFLFFSSCATPDAAEINKAKATAEQLMNSIKEEKIDELIANCTKNFFLKITKENWTEEFKTSLKLTGPIEKYKLTKFKIQKSLEDTNDLVFIYEAQHSKCTSQHEFTIVLEDGKYKMREYYSESVLFRENK